MALLHVNSTTGGTPTSPYDTWAKAATTLGAAGSVAVAGDTVYVHPSHSESAATGISWAGTQTNPIKIICGTPDTVSGVTALQNTAIWGISAAGASQGFNGAGGYVHGLNFRINGSTGSAIISIATTAVPQWTFNECQFYYAAAGGGVCNMGYNAEGEGIISLNNCQFRYGATGHSWRLLGNVQMRNCSVLSGGTTPTAMFTQGYSTNDAPGLIEVDGFDFSALSNSVKLGGFGKVGLSRWRNVKVPSGWGTVSNPPQSAELLSGALLELLNYGSGDTNHQFWIERKTGRAMHEDTIKTSLLTTGNDTATFSMRMQSLTNVKYPHAIFRSPPITKYVVANGQYKNVSAYLVYDGSARLTNEDIWIEVSARNATGSVLHHIYTGQQSILDTSPNDLADSLVAWDGATGTGPNGSSTWFASYVECNDVMLMENSLITVQVCMSIAAKTIFVMPDFVLIDAGAIGP